MKAVVQAAWLMTDAIGSLVTILISESSILPTIWGTLYLFAALMVATTGLHIYLATKYTFAMSS